MYNKLYLNVPYEEKEEAKKLGAKWNPNRKQWYYSGKPSEYIKFAKWLFDIETCSGVTIICDNIYILEAKMQCWKCKKEISVVGLGIEKFIEIYDTEENDEYGNPIYEERVFGFNNEKELYVTWVENEKECPNFLLKFLKENYNVKVGFSQIVGKTFANHCPNCNALQGNFFVFEEIDSPFSLLEGSEEGNIEKIQKMKIKKIKLDENFKSDFSYGFTGNEYLYLKYGKVEEINLDK